MTSTPTPAAAGKPRRALLSTAWTVVGTLSVTETVSYGILYYSFTVFVTPMQDALGWSHTDVTGAFSLSLLISGLAALLYGRWIDRHGARLMMTVGAVCASLLVLAWAFVDSLWAFYTIWFGLGLASAAVLYDPAFALVARWFPERKSYSAALTVLTFVAGFASVIFLPLVGALEQALGWRQALMVLAGILALCTILPHALLIRDVQRPSAADPVDGTAARKVVPVAALAWSAPFLWLTTAFTLEVFVTVGLGVHLVPYLLALGYEATMAAGIGGAIGVLALPGRVIFTPLGGWVSRHAVAAALFLSQAAGVAILSAGPRGPWLWAFAALYGLGFGAISPARAALLRETFGTTHYGALNGRMTLLSTAARAAAPVSISVMLGALGGYQAAIGLLAVLSVAAAVTVWLARGPAALADESHPPPSNTGAPP